MRDHGGNLDWAIKQFGGAPEDWIDLSTGINPEAYPVPKIEPRAWTALPTASDMAGLIDAARAAYGTTAGLLPVAGAQAAIQMLPRALPAGQARVLGPTYNEHAAAFLAAGWRVETVHTVADLHGADVAIVVNPNNPDGRVIPASSLMALAKEVGTLIVDESFVDPDPALSVGASAGGNLFVLRSFGKFYGLAGLRLGFVLGDVARLADIAGPWPVSGAAIAVGKAALRDDAWAAETKARLQKDAARLDDLAISAGWQVVGGTPLFRLYETPDASAAQDRLARHHIWSRIFPYSDRWVRLGLPGAAYWAQAEAAFRT